MSWHEEGSVPSEPLFVGRPGAIREDDGELRLSYFLGDLSVMMMSLVRSGDILGQ